MKNIPGYTDWKSTGTALDGAPLLALLYTDGTVDYEVPAESANFFLVARWCSARPKYKKIRSDATAKDVLVTVEIDPAHAVDILGKPHVPFAKWLTELREHLLKGWPDHEVFVRKTGYCSLEVTWAKLQTVEELADQLKGLRRAAERRAASKEERRVAALARREAEANAAEVEAETEFLRRAEELGYEVKKVSK